MDKKTDYVVLELDDEDWEEVEPEPKTVKRPETPTLTIPVAELELLLEMCSRADPG